MPALDRRITLEQDHGTRNQFSEYVPDWQVLEEVWARRTSAGAIDTPTVGGVIISEARNYTIRWRQDVAALDPRVLRIRDDVGQYWNVENISEPDERRRAIFIQCIRVT